MSGAVFVLTINLSLGLFLAGGFWAVARFDARNAPARWFALAYGLGALTYVAELAIHAGIAVPVSRLATALLFLAALLVTVMALARRFSLVQDKTGLIAIFAASVLLYVLILDLPRDDFTRQMLYQLPYALVAALAAATVWRGRRWGGFEIALFAILVLTTLHFLIKPFLAQATGGVGEIAQDYASTLYALISQSSGAVLALAMGIVSLTMVASDSAAAIVRHAERDAETGLLHLRGFEDRAARLLRSGDAETSALILCDLDPGPDDGFDADAARALAHRLAGASAPGTLAARLGASRFAVLIPGANLFAARQHAETVRTTLDGVSFRASFGITEREPGDALSDLMARAEWALEEARRAGGNCVRLAARSGLAPIRPQTG